MSSPSSSSEQRLAQALAERDAELERLRARLQELDDEPTYQEAEAMGVVELVRKSRLPDRQQRRLSVAIVREARANGLDPLLVLAVIRCESGFDSFAVSPVGAMGLMQLMPDTGDWLLTRRGLELRKRTNLFDVELNVEIGAAYLSELIREFGTIERALVAYNAGPGAAGRILAKAASRKKFMSGYPAKVMAQYRSLQAQYEEDRTRRLMAQAMLPGSTPVSAIRMAR
ncbi:MAG TPA: lytic transglycosylase domain-containing protein [Myxococcales bacterium]|nr:lytic transglycosylase domain-containing protein [Myxococcales bacterium]